MDFYYGRWVPVITALPVWKASPHPRAFYVYTTEKGKKELETTFPGKIKQQWQFEDQKQGTLALPFLNPNTRAQEVKKTWLLHIEK